MLQGKPVTTVHEGKKQFKCNICNTNFGKKDHLNRHVKAVHEEKKQFFCEICVVQLKSKLGMMEHIAAIHGGIKKNQI